MLVRADAEDAQYNAIVALYNAGQWQAAIDKIEERQKQTLTDAMKSKYLYAKALAFEKGAKQGDARAAYEQVVTQFASSPEAEPSRVALAYLDYARGEIDSVIARYPKIDQAKLSAANKKNLSLIYAECLYAKKDEKGAFVAYKAAIAAGADSAAIAPKLFDLSLRSGSHADVLAASANGVAGVQPDVVALARAEALLALTRFAEADAEAAKVAQTSGLFPRASFARAQALIRLNKLKEAAAPLKAAITGMKDPVAPPAAHLALVECLLESNQPDEASAALDQAEKVIRSQPESDRARLGGQASLLRLRMTGTDRKKMIAAATAARASVPKEQLPKVLYARLFAMSEEGEHKAIVSSMKEDWPLMQGTPEEGAAMLLYYKSLKETKRSDEANALLEDFVKRKADAPEASSARLMIANSALEKNDLAGARAAFDALAADAKAPGALGKNAFDEAMFNRALVTQRAGDQAAAIKVLAALVASNPDAELLKRALPVLGQGYALQKDYANAIAAWKRALTTKVENEADLRDRLARVMLAANDHNGAAEQCAALATLVGGEQKMSRESREVWARSLFAGGKYAESAAKSLALAGAFADSPGYFYEAGVAFEKAGNRAEAAKCYASAQAAKSKLPPAYAAAVDANLASLRLAAGEGDLGVTYWIDQAVTPAGPDKNEKPFDAAIASLRRIAAVKPLDESARKRLSDAMNAQGVDQPRRYMLAAIVLQSLWSADRPHDALAMSKRVTDEFAENEKKLDPKSTGATLAPAMLFYYRGESLRRHEKYADALVAYETVLSSYPYNEWPDAAACGAAECFASLNQREVAIAKFKEVLAGPNTPASAKWRELATKRIAELEKEKGR